uniref:Interleukin 17a/f1 n=1 Tax=Sphaeramia orbicularis TaxID=375764 RepID=A0A673BTK5_9TELE
TDSLSPQVCCSALWVVSSSVVKAPPRPGCDSTLAFSSDVLSLSEGGGDIHSRSVSPWRWRSSTVKTRIPSTLWEAECSSSFCSGADTRRTDVLGLNSVPVYQNLLVLTRQEGGDCFNASYRSVAVGCTCVWAKSTPGQD